MKMKHKKKIQTEASAATVAAEPTIALWQKLIPPCILTFFAAVTYYPSLHYAFQFDDVANIPKHFQLRHYTFFDLFFSGPRWISYWLNSIHYSIGKFDPFSYRVFNVTLHTVNGILLFFIILMICSRHVKHGFFKEHSLSLATLTSLFFVLHPVQTQTVSYVIQGELEGLAAFFIFSMVLCFLSATRVAGAARLIRYGLLFGLAFLSSGTKEIAVISPALIMLVDWFFVSCGSWQSFKKRLLLHALLTMLVLGSYLYLLKPAFFTQILSLQREAKNNIGNIITAEAGEKILPWPFFRSQFKVILHYLWMFVWPFTISVEYDWVLSKSFFAADCFVPFLALVALGGFIVVLLRRNLVHPIAFGLLWFFVAIAPRSSIIPSPELLVDYKTYTASLGWLFVLAAALIAVYRRVVQHSAFLQRPLPEKSRLLLSVLILALPLSYATMQRNLVWSDGLQFWGNVIKNAPGKARAYNNYGVELSLNRQQYREAIPYFKKAIAMDPYYSDPCNNIAVAYAYVDDIDLAIDALKQGLKINPYYPEGYNNLASFLIKKKDYDQALNVLQIALKIRPYYGKAYFNMGRIYNDLNDLEKAWDCFKKCCTQADLDNEFGFALYGQSSMVVKKYADAKIAYKKVMEINPNNMNALFDLGNAHYFTAEYDEAIACYEKIVAKEPHECRAWYNLGEAYLVKKDAQKALACFEKVQTKQFFPALPLRIALCYDNLGNRKRAQELEDEFVRTGGQERLRVATNIVPSRNPQTVALDARL